MGRFSRRRGSRRTWREEDEARPTELPMGAKARLREIRTASATVGFLCMGAPCISATATWCSRSSGRGRRKTLSWLHFGKTQNMPTITAFSLLLPQSLAIVEETFLHCTLAHQAVVNPLSRHVRSYTCGQQRTGRKRLRYHALSEKEKRVMPTAISDTSSAYHDSPRRIRGGWVSRTVSTSRKRNKNVTTSPCRFTSVDPPSNERGPNCPRLQQQ